jgi:hypothetical protein
VRVAFALGLCESFIFTLKSANIEELDYSSALFMGLTSFDGRSFTIYLAGRRDALHPNLTILNSFVSRVKAAFQAPQLAPAFA